MHPEEIAFHAAPGANAVAMLGQAGWHSSAELIALSITTVLPLPPRWPELDPV